ncbi:MAG: glycosyltransferase family 4 protein [Planctomycetes bacterium]|nr:glycosyltransferase family 4 protein [Planctomycetota bacterium]
MSILHLNYSRGWGGLEMYSADLFRGLIAAGRDVRALVRAGSPLERHLTGLGFADRLHADDPKKYLDRAAGRRLRVLVAQHEVEVIHTFKSADIALATLPLRRLGKARPGVVHHLQMLPGHSRRDPFHWYCYRGLDRVVAITRQIAERLPRLWPVSASKVRTIYHGLELEPFAPAPGRRERARERWQLPRDATIIGLVGRIYADKGQRFLFDVFARLAAEHPGVHLLLAGEPEGEGEDQVRAEQYYADLRAAVDDSGLASRVHFTGYCDDVPELMQAIDVFAFSSRPEAFGLVVIEAMASGCITLGPRAGGVPEIIDDGVSGLLYATRDEDDLERALRRALALTDEQRAEMQAAAAQRLAERFSRSRMISEVAALYDEVARERMALR